jgi:hypothetical protein
MPPLQSRLPAASCSPSRPPKPRVQRGDAINEECFIYHECWRLKPFIRSGKAVFHVEYAIPRREFCPRARALGFSSMRKHLSLRAWRRTCW